MRTVVWVSAGAASAVAAHLALRQGPCTLAFCDTGSEDVDTYRFLEDVQEWLGQPIERLRSTEYKNVDDVIARTRFMAGHHGARCSIELKRRVRFQFQRPDDRQAFGYTVDELDRAKRTEESEPAINWWWPLIEAGLTKSDCLAMVERAGLTLPRMYAMGYPNANCVGCVRANNFTYWNLIRQDFPDVFATRAAQERELGHAICKDANGPVFLDELDPARGKGRPVPDYECSIMCAIAESLPPVADERTTE